MQQTIMAIQYHKKPSGAGFEASDPQNASSQKQNFSSYRRWKARLQAGESILHAQYAEDKNCMMKAGFLFWQGIR